MEGTTIVLMGRTGNGKSSTGNSILGRHAFAPGWSSSSATKESQLEQSRWNDGRTLNVVDTPGLFDTKVSKEFLEKEIVKCIDLAKNRVHGILYVVSVRNRFTAEEAAVIDSLQVLFGANIVKYMVVVFTGGDELEADGLTLEEYLNDCPEQLQEVLQLCNMRMVLFDNKTTLETKKEKQRSELLKQIDNLIAENGGQPYSFEPFRGIQESLEKLLTQKGSTKEKMEKADAEQLERLNYMVEQNIRASEEMVQGITKKLEEQLVSTESARIQFENEALLANKKNDEEILRLQKELIQSKNALNSIKNKKPAIKISCPFL